MSYNLLLSPSIENW